MSWARVQSKSGQSSLATSLTVSMTSTPVTGNKIIAVVGMTYGGAGNTISSVQDGNSNSLTQALTITNSTGSCRQYVYFYDAPATPSASIKANISGNQNDCNMVVQEVSGLLAGNTTACIDGTVGTLTGTASPTGSPAYTSTAINEYLLALFTDFGNSAVMTQPSGYTLDANSINTSSTADVGVAYKNSTNGTEAGSWTYTTTGNDWCAALLAFKLAASGGGSSVLIQPPPRLYVPVHRASIF